METRSVEATSFNSASIPLHSIRWPAVFAGLSVGLGVYMLLMLFGIATGLSAHEAGGRSLLLPAAVWNTISMVIAALVGGYVAARASGLRRNADGMINGVVAWGAAVLFFSLLAGSASDSAINSMFGGATSAPTAGAHSADSALLGEVMSSVERGDRETTITLLRDRFGLSQEQASSVTDRAMALNGSPGATGPDARSEAVAQTASVASAWLSAIIVLSLLASAGGGLLGARGARQRALHGRYDEQRVVVRHVHNIPLTR